MLRETLRQSNRFHDRFGDGFLLSCMQPRQPTVANIVVGDVATGVVEQASDAVLGHSGGPANRSVSSSKGVVCEHAIRGQAIASHMPNGSGEDPTLRVLWEKSPAYSASAPETTQHRSTQEQLKSSLLSVFGLHDSQYSSFNV